MFYLIDVISPVKKEVLLHAQDLMGPSQYTPVQLHPHLKPQFSDAKFKKGVYKLLGNARSRIGVYVYDFDTATEPASPASPSSLNLALIDDNSQCDLEEIFPKLEYCIEFSSFVVPKRYIAEPDYDIALEQRMEQGVQQGKKDLACKLLDEFKDLLRGKSVQPLAKKLRTYAPSTPSTLVHVPKVEADEETRNQSLGLWLQEQLGKLPQEFVCSGNTKSEHTASRHSRSEEGFSWYVKPTSDHLYGACMTDEYEKCDLECSSGDSTEHAGMDQYQMLANMNKTAADVAIDALHQKRLFRTITIYGLLVVYTKAIITKAYKVVMDFEKGKSKLRRVENASLDITDGFSMVTYLMQQSLVPLSIS